jgi:hypothetical protein
MCWYLAQEFWGLDENLSWKQFCEIIVQCLDSGSSYKAVEELKSGKQGYTIVSEYTNKFKNKMANYKKENMT